MSAPYDVGFDAPVIVRQINPSTLTAFGAAGLVVVETWERPGAALILLE